MWDTCIAADGASRHPAKRTMYTLYALRGTSEFPPVSSNKNKKTKVTNYAPRIQPRPVPVPVSIFHAGSLYMARSGLLAFVGTAVICARHRCRITADATPIITSRMSNLTSLANVPPNVANRCSSFDLASFGKARHCGSPWSAPCFDFSRCRDNKSIYVYDVKVSTCTNVQ